MLKISFYFVRFTIMCSKSPLLLLWCSVILMSVFPTFCDVVNEFKSAKVRVAEPTETG